MAHKERSSPKKSTSPRDHLWLWGWHAVCAALQNPRRKITQVLATQEMTEKLKAQNPLPTSVPLHITTRQVITQKLGEQAVHQGIALATLPLPAPSLTQFLKAATEKATLLALDHVTDPQNLGAIIRSACALGAQGLILTDKNTPPITGTVAKSAAGALEHLPLFTVPNLARALEDTKKRGFWCWGIDERGDTPDTLQPPPEKYVLVMGAEGKGLRPLTRERCDHLMRLPTNPDFPCLNVSVAAALALYACQGR